MKPRSKSVWIVPAALHRRVAGVDGPGADFLFVEGEEGAQPEHVVGAADQRGDAGFLHAQFLQILLRLLRREVGQVALQLRADHHRLAGVMRRGRIRGL